MASVGSISHVCGCVLLITVHEADVQPYGGIHRHRTPSSSRLRILESESEMTAAPARFQIIPFLSLLSHQHISAADTVLCAFGLRPLRHTDPDTMRCQVDLGAAVRNILPGRLTDISLA